MEAEDEVIQRMSQVVREKYFEKAAQLEIQESKKKLFSENQVVDNQPFTQDLSEIGIGTGITFTQVGRGINSRLEGRKYTEPGRMTIQDFKRRVSYQ